MRHEVNGFRYIQHHSLTGSFAWWTFPRYELMSAVSVVCAGTDDAVTRSAAKIVAGQVV